MASIVDNVHVQIDATDQENLIANHSGQLTIQTNAGTPGWLGATRDDEFQTTIVDVSGFQSPAWTDNDTRYEIENVYVTTPPPGVSEGVPWSVFCAFVNDWPVTAFASAPPALIAPGDYVGFVFSAIFQEWESTYTDDPVIEWRIVYYDTNDDPLAITPVTASAGLAAPDGGPVACREVRGVAATPAPNNTVAARLQLRAARSTGPWTSAYLSADVHVSKLYMLRDTDPTALDGLTFVREGADWVDIQAELTTLSVRRGGQVDGVTDKIDPGTLTATLRTTDLTPVNDPRIRRGRPIRVMKDRGDYEAYEPIFRGRIATADVTYGNTKRDPDAKPTMVITATDAVAELREHTHPFGYTGDAADATVDLFARANWPHPWHYEIQRPADPPPHGEIASRITDGTLYDQLNLIAATFPDVRWYVAADGRVTVENYSPPWSLPITDGSDSPDFTISYTEIDVNFGSAALVNNLTVRKINLTERDGEKVYGPYLNQESTIQWGKAAGEVTVNGGTPRVLAERYLATFDTPQIFARSASFHVAPEDFQVYKEIARVELYDKVAVTHGPSGLAGVEYHVIGIEHDITAEQWYAKLTFRPIVAPGEVSVVDPPGGPNSGPNDVVAPAPAPMSLRYRSSPFEIPHSSRTAIPFDQLDTAHDYRMTYDEVNARWVIDEEGRYFAAACALWDINNDGNRFIYVAVNGVAVMRTGGDAIANGPHANQIATALYCRKGDHVQILVWQGSDAPLDIRGGGNFTAASLTYLDW